MPYRLTKIALISIVFLNFAYAQRDVQLASRVVFKGSSDTADLKLYAKRSLTNPGDIALKYILTDKLTFIDRYKKNKVLVDRLDYFEFMDLDSAKRVFIQEYKVGIRDSKNFMLEVVHLGTISFYRKYSVNAGMFSNDGIETRLFANSYRPPVLSSFIPNTYSISDYFSFNGNPPIHMDLAYKKYKRELIQKIPDRRDLHDRINNMTTYEELVQILIDFDSDPEDVAKRVLWNSIKGKKRRLNSISKIENIEVEVIKHTNQLKSGDMVKYIGVGNEKFAFVEKLTGPKSAKIQLLKDDDSLSSYVVKISQIEKVIESKSLKDFE